MSILKLVLISLMVFTVLLPPWLQVFMVSMLLSVLSSQPFVFSVSLKITLLENITSVLKLLLGIGISPMLFDYPPLFLLIDEVIVPNFQLM